jgi:hypothetical protein
MAIHASMIMKTAMEKHEIHLQDRKPRKKSFRHANSCMFMSVHETEILSIGIQMGAVREKQGDAFNTIIYKKFQAFALQNAYL